MYMYAAAVYYSSYLRVWFVSSVVCVDSVSFVYSNEIAAEAQNNLAAGNLVFLFPLILILMLSLKRTVQPQQKERKAQAEGSTLQRRIFATTAGNLC